MTLIFMKCSKSNDTSMSVRLGALAAFCLLLGLALLPQPLSAQRATSRTGVSADYQVSAVVIQVYDVDKGSETIAELEPGGTVTLNPGQKARLRMAVKTGNGNRTRYPIAAFTPDRPLTAISPIRTGDRGGFTFLGQRQANRQGPQAIDYEITDPDYAVPRKLMRGRVFVALADVEPPKPAPVQPSPVEPRPDAPAPKRLGVTLFVDSGFRGLSERMYSSDPNLRDNVIGNDRLSSIQVDRGCVARLFEASEYRGEYAEVRFDLGDLESVRVRNDHVSSIQIDCSEDATRYGRDERDRDDRGRDAQDERDRYDRERDDRDFRQGATLYSDSNFRGDLSFFRDGSYADLRRTEVGEQRASSIAVSPGCVAVLYQSPNFRGESIEVDRDLDSFSRTRLGSDAVASIRVLCR